MSSGFQRRNLIKGVQAPFCLGSAQRRDRSRESYSGRLLVRLLPLSPVPLQAQLTSTLTGLLARRHDPSIGLDAECGLHFDQAFSEAVDLLLLVSHRLVLDPPGLAVALRVLESGAADHRSVWLAHGGVVYRAGAGLGVGPVPRAADVTWQSALRVDWGVGIFCFPLCQCCLLLLKLLGERLQFVYAPVSFGQLAVELVHCGSMLCVSIAELHFQPMDPSLGRFEFLHARA